MPRHNLNTCYTFIGTCLNQLFLETIGGLLGFITNLNGGLRVVDHLHHRLHQLILALFKELVSLSWRHTVNSRATVVNKTIREFTVLCRNREHIIHRNRYVSAFFCRSHNLIGKLRVDVSHLLHSPTLDKVLRKGEYVLIFAYLICPSLDCVVVVDLLTNGVNRVVQLHQLLVDLLSLTCVTFFNHIVRSMVTHGRSHFMERASPLTKAFSKHVTDIDLLPRGYGPQGFTSHP